MRRRRILTAAAVVLAGALTAGLAWFQPWKLFLDHRVTETLPTVAVRDVADTPSRTAGAATPTTRAPRATPSARATTTNARDVLLARGRFISHEHDTSGAVSVVRLADGRRVLAIAGLATSDGPDVHVWLTDAPVLAGEAGWYVFDDGAHVSLGTLKGNLGDQVYEIPVSADLTRLTSVTLWCDRFDVSFGAARLRAVG